MGIRRQRFSGAGGSAERQFNLLRRQNIRDEWRAWSLIILAVIGLTVWSAFTGEITGRVLAATAGLLVGMLFVFWALGGHVSAFRWRLGAMGERDTGKEIEKLGPEWHCEHDLVHGRGNWDHVLIGPPGVFLLDSKLLHGTAAAGDDALRSGRLTFAGGSFRFGAKRVKVLLEERLGFRAPWVQAVAVVWADFPQGQHEEQDVVYLRGDQLRPWLSALPQKMTAPQRAALETAIREVRTSLDSK
jgi:nuclease-like protein